MRVTSIGKAHKINHELKKTISWKINVDDKNPIRSVNAVYKNFTL
jgi:hypothetical protein